MLARAAIGTTLAPLATHMGGRSAVGAAVAVWLGLLLGAQVGARGAGAALAVAVVFAWLACRAPARVGTAALLVALALAGVARGGARQAVLERERSRITALGTAGWVDGRVAEPPARESGEPTAVIVVRRARPPLLEGTRVRLRLPSGCGAEWGDNVRALVRLDPPPAPRNPGGYDAASAAAADGIAAVGRALAARTLPARGLDALPRVTVARWRRALERRYQERLSPEARELVVPFVVGDRSALSAVLNARFRASGLIHILALSGLHVTWLAVVARGIAAALGRGVRARALAGALCACLYAGLAGPLPSLMRAAATEVLGATARALDRALDPVQALALSALGLLAAAPGWALDLGFQLSFAATVGLVTVGPWLAERAGRWRPALALVIPTASAQVTALPLLAARFHALSWTGPIANLAAVPIAGLLLSAAWLAALIDLALPGAGAPWFGACEVLSAALRACAEVAGGLRGALFATGPEVAVAWCAGAGAALLALSLPGPRHLAGRLVPASRARVAGLSLGGFGLALALVLAVTVRPLTPPPGRWWLVMLDVGQGDALALGFPDGWWLVDAGPRTPRMDAAESVVLPFLRWAGVRRLAALVLTHDDGDHAGGAPALLRAMPVRDRLSPAPLPGLPGPAGRFRARSVARGDTLRRDPAVVVLWPPRTLAPDPRAAGAWARRGDNAGSLVLEVGGEGARALLMADADSLVEDSLAVARGVTLLKVGHHGAPAASGDRFVAGLRPPHAVVSAGRHNPFGHPAPRVLASLAAAGAWVHRTDREGALWFEFSASGVRRIDWRRGAPGAPAAPAPRLARPRPGW